ncbi:cyclophilin-like fold protein [Methylophaga sp. OBS3]|uniref:cyclophilin-like fold protein n=1 Tax=Methylophaga sp. OBS3 TaxID=2991934 RepID=UPI00225A3012|nr:cyclophilin-like fold protein [Methylophaga sp. OBS3]MCX4189243.1 cyclophilin-like fold protein [Methylophaga sp. OBS3]
MTKVQITTGTSSLVASLDDSAASRDFIKLLPLTVTLDDFHQTEKIVVLPEALSTDGAASGYSPRKGDIAYYKPWGNLAIFYKDFGHSAGLIRLGHIDNNLQVLSQSGSLDVTIELID